MPGIAGIYTADHTVQVDSVLDKMLSAMEHRKDCRKEFLVPPGTGCAFGIVSLGAIQENQEIAHSPDGAFSLVLDGELYGIQAELSGAEALAKVISRDDFSNLESLRGEFSAALLDKKQKRISLVSDKFGLKPLYYAPLPGGFAFASEVKALLMVPGVGRDYNWRSFADLYHFGFVLGNKTLFAGLQLLPPASVLSFDCEQKKYSLEAYWKQDTLFAAQGQEGEGGELEVAEAFKSAVDRRYKQSESIGISLSGGLDSRSILAVLGERAREMPSYTLGLPGCRDQVLTERMARLTGTRHEFLELTARDLGDFRQLAETLVFLSDGFYHPHEATEKKALDYFEEAPFRIVLRGHAGEVAKASLAYPLQVTSDVIAMTSRDDVIDFILNSAGLGMQDIAPDNLFQPFMAAVVKEGPVDSLGESFASLDKDLAAADMCLYIYIREWIRRQVVASLSIFRSQVEVRLPFMDEDFLASLLKLPLQKRYAGEVHRNVVKRYYPELAKIPDSNTGAPLTAGRMRLFFSDKMNSVLKRISLPGFRHYTEFEDWQRKQFRERLETILFDEETLDRGIYNPDFLKKTFQEHVQGRRSCARLLGTIVGIELYMRRYSD